MKEEQRNEFFSESIQIKRYIVYAYRNADDGSVRQYGI